MLLRLGGAGTIVRIFKTRCVCFDTVEYKGRPRKLFQTEMEKLVEFPVYESAEAHMSTIANEDGEPAFSAEDIQRAEEWIEQQMQEIDAAFRKNQNLGLMGGTAVIKRSSKDDQKYCSHDGFISGRKVGEFIGVIRGAHGYKPKMRKKVKMPHVEVGEPDTAAKAWEEGRFEDINNENLIRMRVIAKERGKPLDKAFTEEEVFQFYIAERQAFYMLTRTMKNKQNGLEKACRERAEKKHSELMKQQLV